MSNIFPYTNPYMSQQPLPLNPYVKARNQQQPPLHNNTTHRQQQHHSMAPQQQQQQHVPSFDGILKRLADNPYQKDLVHSLEQSIRQQTTSSWTWASIDMFVDWIHAVLHEDKARESE